MWGRRKSESWSEGRREGRCGGEDGGGAWSLSLRPRSSAGASDLVIRLWGRAAQRKSPLNSEEALRACSSPHRNKKGGSGRREWVGLVGGAFFFSFFLPTKFRLGHDWLRRNKKQRGELWDPSQPNPFRNNNTNKTWRLFYHSTTLHLGFAICNLYLCKKSFRYH